MRREKKSESLEVRLGHSQKRDFMEICKSRGLTASDVVRGFISGVIEDAQRTECETPAPTRLKELSMTFRKNPRKIVASSAGAFGALALFAMTPSVADDDVFSRLDANKDGKLVAEEISDPSGGGFESAKVMVENMDLDGDGSLSRAEFHGPTGCMVRREDKLEDDGETKSRSISLNMLAYDFSDEEMSKISSVTSDMLVDEDISDEAAEKKAEAMMADMRKRIQKETGDPNACQPREGGKKIEKRIKKTEEIEKSQQ